jgi:hypothetical protein
MLFLVLCPCRCLRLVSCSSKWLCQYAIPTGTESKHSFSNRLISALACFLAASRVVVAAKNLNHSHFSARSSRLRCWTIWQRSILCEFKSLVITSRISWEDRRCGQMLTWKEDAESLDIRCCASQRDHVTWHVTILQLQLFHFFSLFPYFHPLRWFLETSEYLDTVDSWDSSLLWRTWLNLSPWRVSSSLLDASHAWICDHTHESFNMQIHDIGDRSKQGVRNLVDC